MAESIFEKKEDPAPKSPSPNPQNTSEDSTNKVLSRAALAIGASEAYVRQNIKPNQYTNRKKLLKKPKMC